MTTRFPATPTARSSARNTPSVNLEPKMLNLNRAIIANHVASWVVFDILAPWFVFDIRVVVLIDSS